MPLSPGDWIIVFLIILIVLATADLLFALFIIRRSRRKAHLSVDTSAHPRKIYDAQSRPWSLKRGNGKDGQTVTYQLATTGPPEECSWSELWALLSTDTQKAFAHLAPQA